MSFLQRILGNTYRARQEAIYTTKDNVIHRSVKFSTEEVGCGRKACIYCRKHGVRTAAGRPCEATRKCDMCDVALCINFRECWIKHHIELDQSIPDEVYDSYDI